MYFIFFQLDSDIIWIMAVYCNNIVSEHFYFYFQRTPSDKTLKSVSLIKLCNYWTLIHYLVNTLIWSPVNSVTGHQVLKRFVHWKNKIVWNTYAMRYSTLYSFKPINLVETKHQKHYPTSIVIEICTQVEFTSEYPASIRGYVHIPWPNSK